MGYNYYPFGLTFNSYQRVTGKENNFLYNGKEKQDAIEIGWFDFHARMYNPALGRFASVDPLGEVKPEWSSYRFGYNNPIRYNDPTGMIEVTVNGEELQGKEKRKFLRSFRKNLREMSKSAQSQQNADDSDPQKEVKIEFDPGADASKVSDYTKGILTEIGISSGNNRIAITSTARDAEAQARVMFNNLERDLAEQRRTYKAPGQRIIDVYVALKKKGLSDSEIKAAMTKAILNEGPSNVSRHAADPAVVNVIDISIRRLANPAAFKEAAMSNPVIRLLDENNVFHLEIQQPKPTED